ncbi:MAG TPA: NeuD/PglB/VioB family sugar acetyltransferase [Allosphingosinicella sp.]|jgi:sugar O-acyltransferase (sialic acid O-acetyltransferase NeuD family)
MTAAGRIVIVGGGGFGRELISHVTDCHEAGRLPAVGGYIDDGGEVLAPLGYDLPWLGPIEDYRPSPGDLCVLAIGSSTAKRAVVGKLKARGAAFATMVHPSSVASRRTTMGEGVIIGTHAGAGVDTRIGDFVTINSYSALGHDASVGSYTTLSSHVDVTGYVQIGADVFIGSNATILPNVRIGDGASIGAGSVVYRSVGAGKTVFAPPAKLLKLPGRS